MGFTTLFLPLILLIITRLVSSTSFPRREAFPEALPNEERPNYTTINTASATPHDPSINPTTNPNSPPQLFTGPNASPLPSQHRHSVTIRLFISTLNSPHYPPVSLNEYDQALCEDLSEGKCCHKPPQHPGRPETSFANADARGLPADAVLYLYPDDGGGGGGGGGFPPALRPSTPRTWCAQQPFAEGKPDRQGLWGVTRSPVAMEGVIWWDWPVPGQGHGQEGRWEARRGWRRRRRTRDVPVKEERREVEGVFPNVYLVNGTRYSDERRGDLVYRDARGNQLDLSAL
ncbi:MAG: hypothetical protein M1833_003251 [Piccolia ochrophora]|nr:MAG: hypothetical protein M1833_003251 [Piccolia ochrophora]